MPALDPNSASEPHTQRGAAICQGVPARSSGNCSPIIVVDEGVPVRRRQFILLLGSATTWPFATRAQSSGPRRIGVLALTRADEQSFANELREGLRALGHAEGQTYQLEARTADGNAARLPELAADLVRLRVDVLAAIFTPCALAAKQVTSTIPIVIVSVGDPVASGLVASLARPGRNITGLSNMAPETAGKGVELLRDMLPALRRVGVLANPVDLSRVLLLLQFDLGALAGYTGAVFERFFGALQGSLWAVAALTIWIVGPVAIGLRQFARKDL